MSDVAKSVLALSLMLAWSTLYAQGARDPTLPPPDAGLSSQVVPNNVPGGPEPGLSMVVRGGIFYVVQGTRLVAQGQKLGEARIERISETEVWLRQGGVLTKRALFAGITRQPISQAGVSASLQLSRSTP
jgi:hypothetical protein